MEIVFKAEEIIGLAVMLNNGTIPFMGVATLLPQGVENVFKWKPSFMFDKLVKENTKRFEQMGILESYEFTNLACVLLKSTYQISTAKSEEDENKPLESIFLADNNASCKMVFNEDGTYTVTDGFETKKLVGDFARQAKEQKLTVFLKEKQAKPIVIQPEDIEETFNLMHI